ncbi:MAG: hypothetical protein P1U56_10275 [Saprospiraceae bacterium]|nr:hypothetical protein [Saprospiraceae bacterium]
MENQTFGAVRTGGPAVLSTVLHRGMASRHLGVLWGGFNIQSAVNGTFDFNLIRNSFDQAKFYQNGTSIITGNASMAGAIGLSNVLTTSNSTALSLYRNTTKNTSVNLINKTTYKKYSQHIGVQFTKDQNEYSYKNGPQIVKQDQAEFNMWDVNYSARLSAFNQWMFSWGGWFQQADRQIPPTKTSVNIDQNQKDVNYRGYAHISYALNTKSRLRLRSAYFNEKIEYTAPGIFSLSHANVYNSAIDFVHDSGFTLGSQIRLDRVDASFYDPKHNRNTIAFFANKELQIKSLELGLSMRYERIDGSSQPLVMGLRLKKELSSRISTELRYNKSYTLPSFNDLYWPSGGNPLLKTENSHEFDLDFAYTNKKEGSIHFNLFFNLIDDWIQWTPIEGFFQPVNQRKVRNIGLEFRYTDSYKISQNGKIKLNLLYGFTDSRLIKHYYNADFEGNRTVFVPQHKVTGSIAYLFTNWRFQLNPIYYSKRFDTTDNSTSVSGFFLMDFEIQKSIPLNKRTLSFLLNIENGLNNDYENIRFYPMPLRILTFGIQLKM